jgi:hypothetical protein
MSFKYDLLPIFKQLLNILLIREQDFWVVRLQFFDHNADCMLYSLVRLFKHTEKAAVAGSDARGNNFETRPIESCSKRKERRVLVLPLLTANLFLEKFPYQWPNHVLNQIGYIS